MANAPTKPQTEQEWADYYQAHKDDAAVWGNPQEGCANVELSAWRDHNLLRNTRGRLSPAPPPARWHERDHRRLGPFGLRTDGDLPQGFLVHYPRRAQRGTLHWATGA